MPTSSDIITADSDLFAPGVAMNAPPASMLADTARLVVDAMAQIPDGERGSLVAIATKTAGVTTTNLAFAVKAGGNVEVVTWIGKTWGTPVAAKPLSLGAAARWHF